MGHLARPCSGTAACRKCLLPDGGHRHSTLSKNAHSERSNSGQREREQETDSARGKSELHTSDWMPLCASASADSDSNFDSQSKLINFCTHSIDTLALWSCPALPYPPCSTAWAIRKTLLLASSRFAYATLQHLLTVCSSPTSSSSSATGLVPESTRQMAKT